MYSRWFGCGRDDKTGQLCAKEYAAHESNQGDMCAIWVSCCGGDYFRVVRSALTPERADAGCPGAIKASSTTCST